MNITSHVHIHFYQYFHTLNCETMDIYIYIVIKIYLFFLYNLKLDKKSNYVFAVLCNKSLPSPLLKHVHHWLPWPSTFSTYLLLSDIDNQCLIEVSPAALLRRLFKAFKARFLP